MEVNRRRTENDHKETQSKTNTRSGYSLRISFSHLTLNRGQSASGPLCLLKILCAGLGVSCLEHAGGKTSKAVNSQDAYLLTYSLLTWLTLQST